MRILLLLIMMMQYLLHYHYQEEEDEDKEEEVKEPQCAHPPPLDNDDLIGSNQCLCLPKAELNTKNSTKRQLCCCLVEFLVFNSVHQKKSDSSKTLNREEDDVICG